MVVHGKEQELRMVFVLGVEIVEKPTYENTS